MSKPLRVIHCGTGVAGSQALRSIILQDGLELAGLLVNSESNVGKDAGTFARLPDCGVLATRDLDSLVATPADVVLYMLLIPNIDHICAFLESGKNVVTTAGFVFPQFNNKEVDRRLRESCEKGQTSFYSSGLNPGVVDEILPLSLSRVCESWDTVYVAEYAWLARYPSAPMLFDMMGFGKTQEEIDNGAAKDMPLMTELFSAGCAALGHELGVEIDEVREEREFVMTDKPLEIHAGSVEAGTMAGQRWRWTGYVKGVPRVVQETFWIIDYDLGEGWPETGSMEGSKWEIRIEGRPSVRCQFEIRRSFVDPTQRGYPASGTATGMSALNSVADVVAAPPGLLLASDLPQARMRLSRFGTGLSD
jgi:2,4-diaminopentanoate dehydrogenase